MSLRPCRECGHRVSTKASSCPSCGVSNPATGIGAGCGCRSLFLLGLFGVLAFGVGVAVRLWEGPRPPGPDAIRGAPEAVGTATRGPMPEASSFPGLTAGLTRSAGSIHVTNADTFEWNACTVDLNAGSFPGGYSAAVGRVRAGEAVRADLRSFVRDGRERFDPSTRIVSVDVHCDTPLGRAHHNSFFR